MLARVRINAFRIELVECCYEDLLSSAVASVEAEVAVGNAVYMLPSFYNHDCGKVIPLCFELALMFHVRYGRVTRPPTYECE